MNIRNKKYRKQNKLILIVLNHLENNFKEYFIIGILFLVGIFIGIIFVNNSSVEQSNYISNYLQTSILNFKTESEIDELLLFKESILKNFILVILLWFMGSTVIGIIIVHLIILFKGFCLGYTISSIIFAFGTTKGSLFLISALFLQNLIFIPCLISLGVSGMQLYKSIMQNCRKENIKLEIIRHTMFSIFIFLVLILSSILEAYVSTELLGLVVQYM